MCLRLCYVWVARLGAWISNEGCGRGRISRKLYYMRVMDHSYRFEAFTSAMFYLLFSHKKVSLKGLPHQFNFNYSGMIG
jgi:hypothetical protein